MSAHSYEESKRLVFKGMFILGAVTLVEVGISLFGKGHLGFDPSGSMIAVAIVGFLLIALSLYKAWYIVYKFMHMGSEVKGMRLSVLLPTLLLVWAVIAFFYEGSAWKNNRDVIHERDEQVSEESIKVQGMLYKPEETKELY